MTLMNVKKNLTQINYALGWSRPYISNFKELEIGLLLTSFCIQGEKIDVLFFQLESSAFRGKKNPDVLLCPTSLRTLLVTCHSQTKLDFSWKVYWERLYFLRGVLQNRNKGNTRRELGEKGKWEGWGERKKLGGSFLLSFIKSIFRPSNLLHGAIHFFK